MPEKEYHDLELLCKDCGEGFIWSARDQAFFGSQKDAKTGKSWNPPIRCVACRDINRQRREKQDQQR